MAAHAQEQAEAPLVERVEIQGNRVIQRETLLFYVSTRPGDRYDELRLKDDFRRLWATGFLDDLVLQAVDGPNGRIVVFQVTERKRIQIVDYRGSKELSSTAIDEKLKEKDASIRIDTFYEPSKARRVEEIVRQMLADKGRPFGTVKHDAKALGNAGLQVSFSIDDGPKARIKAIEFEGNQVFDDGKLRGAMKKLKPSGFWNLSWLGGKSTYTGEKWGEEQERVRNYYLDRGYVTATVDKPSMHYSDGKSGFFKKKPVKWMTLTIPVSEGEAYRVGDVKFEGLTVFKEESIRPLFKLQSGEVYRESRIKKAFDKLQEFYGSQGYFQFTGYTERKPDASRKVVDLVLHMEEDKRYYVGRIRFTGNDTTRDKVIRREVYLSEGDVFNTELLKLTIKRINQLGYFKPMEGAPNLGRSPLGEDKLDVTFKVEEQNRSQFTLGGGYSGLEGTFLNGSFATTNFLGLGETLNVSAQTGQRSRNYQLAVTEPYLFDRPITAGLDVFLRRLTYVSSGSFVGYSQQQQGVTLTSGFPVARFSRLYASYGYQIVDIYDVDRAQIERLGLSAADSLQPGRRFESRLAPTLVRNTVDNPWTPRSGTRQSAGLAVVGGPLGGSVSYYSPNAEAVLYHPLTRRSALGFRAQAAYVASFGQTPDVPYYQRFFLGGENQLRGYNPQTVSPVDKETGAATGGNKYVLFNAEYYFDLLEPLRLVLFFDGGEAYARGQGIDPRTFSTSTGAEVRFRMPVLNVPFRLIYAWNANRAPFQPATAFKFAVGTMF
jgi:outer membrane protein insertion porin family